jgi:hypothetical protein
MKIRAPNVRAPTPIGRVARAPENKTRDGRERDALSHGLSAPPVRRGSSPATVY